jgi:hypothetical protein
MTDANRAPVPTGAHVPVSAGERWNVLAIVGFVTALLGFNIVAVILSAIGLNQIKRTGERGRALALWGLWLGIISLVIGIILTIVFIGIAVSGAMVSTH